MPLRTVLLPPHSHGQETKCRISRVRTECFRRGDCRRALPNVQGALAEMDQAIEQTRQSRILSGQKLEPPVRMLELVNRYHATAGALQNGGRLIQTLGDSAVLGCLCVGGTAKRQDAQQGKKSASRLEYIHTFITESIRHGATGYSAKGRRCRGCSVEHTHSGPLTNRRQFGC